MELDTSRCVQLQSTKPDSELAADYRAELAPLMDQVCEVLNRAELAPLMDQVCEVLNRARKDGLIINYTISPDQFGRIRVAEVQVVKPL